jgi:O-antigen ligase
MPEPVSVPGPGPLPAATRGAVLERAATWAAIALGVSIPISVAADSIFSGLAVLLLLLAGGYREKLGFIATHPVALAALALFAWLALGLLWGDRSPGEGGRYLAKYDDLALLALLLPLFREARPRRAAVLAFAVGLGLTLVVSYAVAVGLVPKSWLRVPDPTSAIAFKLRVTHSFLMAFAAFLFALLARAAGGRKRLGWGVLALLAAFNVLFLVKGQTGWVVLGALLLYLFTADFGWRGLAAAALLGIALGTAGYFTSEALRVRIDETAGEIAAAREGKPATGAESAGLRLEFYRNTAAMIAAHPLLGVGTGGFPKAYAERAAAGRIATDNPHNEYLLIAAQVGLPGLALMLALFATEWRLARHLPTNLERDLARGLVLAVAVGSLFNSLLVDHVEGLLFAWLSAVLFGGLQWRPMNEARPRT